MSAGYRVRQAQWPGIRRISWLFLYVFIFFLSPSWAADTPSNADCLACHDDKSLTTKRGARTVSLYVDGKKVASSIHSSLSCTSCHASLEGKELPHDTPVAKVNCGTCHSSEAELHAKSLHGKAAARGDALAPRCVNCHGNHDILPVKDRRSPVAPLNVPCSAASAIARARRCRRNAPSSSTTSWRITRRASTARAC